MNKSKSKHICCILFFLFFLCVDVCVCACVCVCVWTARLQAITWIMPNSIHREGWGRRKVRGQRRRVWSEQEDVWADG